MESEQLRLYFAGLWDADGSFGIHRRPPYSKRSQYEMFQPIAHISLSDPKAMFIYKLLEESFGFSCRWRSMDLSPSKRTTYRWMLQSQKAVDFARVIEPYLIIKKERAQILMEYPMNSKKYPEEERARVRQTQHDLWIRMKALNKRGRDNDLFGTLYNLKKSEEGLS